MITVKRIMESKILPTITPVMPIGQNWYKDKENGICYRIEELPDEILVVAEVRKSKYKLSIRESHIKIKCIDCENERTIQIQDKFQVTRCVECQEEWRRKKRRERYERGRTTQRHRGSTGG